MVSGVGFEIFFFQKCFSKQYEEVQHHVLSYTGVCSGMLIVCRDVIVLTHIIDYFIALYTCIFMYTLHCIRFCTSSLTEKLQIKQFPIC